MSVPTPQPTAITPSPGLPSGPTLTGPLARYLAHPGAETARLLHHLSALAAHLGPTAGPALAGIALAATVTVTAIRRRQARRLADGARLVRVLAPPEVDPQGAATLWTNLVALLRPAWRRALGGQPHLGIRAHRHRRRAHHQLVGARSRPARPGRASGRSRLARCPHRDPPRHPAARGRWDRHRRRTAPCPARAVPAAHRPQGRLPPPAPRRP